MRIDLTVRHIHIMRLVLSRTQGTANQNALFRKQMRKMSERKGNRFLWREQKRTWKQVIIISALHASEALDA